MNEVPSLTRRKLFGLAVAASASCALPAVARAPEPPGVWRRGSSQEARGRFLSAGDVVTFGGVAGSFVVSAA